LRISKAGIHFAFDTFVSGTYLALRFIIGCKKEKIHIAISYIYIYTFPCITKDGGRGGEERRMEMEDGGDDGDKKEESILLLIHLYPEPIWH
jgi:hypothetical protein